MSQVLPLSSRSRALLLQLELQCHIARRCLLRQRLLSAPAKSFSTQPLKLTVQNPKPSLPEKSQPKEKGDHTPKPLARPLGFENPPLPGENTGLDPRDWQTRRDDFFDYDKHLERRKQLTKQVAKSYFRDWSNMRFQKGKVFIAPPKLFRADKALYFPNLWGFTLLSPKDERDTTPVLHGKISLVAVFSESWAEQQTKTFLEGNEKLDAILKAGDGFLQRADINVEQNRMKAALVKFFMGRIRRQLPEEQHGKYYLVTQGVTDEMRERLGMMNSRVGYIYLLDTECRIRWACSAEALPEEKESMIRGLVRLSKELEKKIDDRDPEIEDLSKEVRMGVRRGVDKVAALVEP